MIFPGERSIQYKEIVLQATSEDLVLHIFALFCAKAGFSQGALKGMNLRGQTEPRRRFSQIFADVCRFSPLILEKKHLGNADFRRKPLIFAGNRRKPQEPAENRRLAFVP